MLQFVPKKMHAKPFRGQPAKRAVQRASLVRCHDHPKLPEVLRQHSVPDRLAAGRVPEECFPVCPNALFFGSTIARAKAMTPQSHINIQYAKGMANASQLLAGGELSLSNLGQSLRPRMQVAVVLCIPCYRATPVCDASIVC